MDMGEAKASAVLNYSLMCADVGYSLSNTVPNISNYFRICDSLQYDSDMIEIGDAFASFCVAFKKMDRIINKIGKSLSK